ncbi:MAG: alpha/beta hydrolase [Kiloniellales bacterium]|nr:alpha/beta hydrolase [Kiloniellales bacterium]
MTVTDPISRAPSKLARPDGHTLAYHATAAAAPGDGRPGVVFCGGFMSDMTGTKATALEAFARREGLGFVRFDYLGHGASSGAFTDGTIGRWAEDAIAVLDEVARGPQVLVGSSMGGWIMLLAALARPQRVAGLVGIAPAPDFTEDLMWERYDAEVRATLERDGVYREPSAYGEAPYPITLRLIEEGRGHLLLRATIPLACPLRILQGMEDADVPWQTALRLAERIESRDVEVTLVKDGDHRLSEPHDLARLCDCVAGLIARLAAA